MVDEVIGMCDIITSAIGLLKTFEYKTYIFDLLLR